MSTLDTINKEFASLYQTRNTEGAVHEGPSASSLKPALAKSYEQVLQCAGTGGNLCAIAEPAYPVCTDDELRVKYARLVSQIRQ